MCKLKFHSFLNRCALRKTVIACFVLLFLVAGQGMVSCDLGPVNTDVCKALKEKPDSSLFFGEWVLNNHAFQKLKPKYSLSDDTIRLHLYPNGHFKASHFPRDVSGFSGHSDNRQVDATGEWKVEDVQHGWGLGLYFDAGDICKNGFVIEAPTYRNIRFNGALMLWIHIDTSDGDYLVFWRPEIADSVAATKQPKQRSDKR